MNQCEYSKKVDSMDKYINYCEKKGFILNGIWIYN